MVRITKTCLTTFMVIISLGISLSMGQVYADSPAGNGLTPMPYSIMGHIDSIDIKKGRLIVNDQLIKLSPSLRVYDADGRRITLLDLKPNTLVRSKLDPIYGSRTNVANEIRILTQTKR